MSGLRLREMEASEMLDVLHFLFEQDNTYSSEEQMKSHSKIRESLYETMYGTTYKYKYVDRSKGNRSYTPTTDFDIDAPQEMPVEEAIKPFNPRAEKPKAYVPPTEFNPTSATPFGNVLDAPMG